MTEKQLRQIAREALANFIKGKTSDTAVRDAAVAALHAPQRKGE